MQNEKISSDLIRGHIDTIILYSIKENDKNAQQISDFVEEKSQFQYKINQATLYSSLKRLENLKYVNSYWNESTEGRRKFYKITQIGNDYVSHNLNSWSFSKEIIDKLMGIEPQKTVVYSYPPINAQEIDNNGIYKPQIIENTPPLNFNEKNVNVSPEKQSNNNLNNIIKPKPNTELETELIPANENPLYSTQSNNFRNILNGLILNSNFEKKVAVEEPKTELNAIDKNNQTETIEPAERQNNEPKVKDFNEVLSDKDYNPQKTSNNGKIDYGDLTLKAAQEGYKIRISSKDSAKPFGSALTNKINLLTILVIYLVCLIELAGISIFAKNVISSTAIILSAGVLTLITLLSLFRFIHNPNKARAKIYYPDKILTTAIIGFNVILITFVLNFVFNVDLSVAKNLIIYLLTPIITVVNFVIYYAIEYFISQSKNCKVKIKK